MVLMRRLVSCAELDGRASGNAQMSVRVRLEVELGDGRRVVLLDDRGWGSSVVGDGDVWELVSAEEVAETARMVVGPDEPPEGRSREQEAAMHWAALAGMLRERGVEAEPGDLARLPHDVEFGERLGARVRGR